MNHTAFATGICDTHTHVFQMFILGSTETCLVCDLVLGPYECIYIFILPECLLDDKSDRWVWVLFCQSFATIYKFILRYTYRCICRLKYILIWMSICFYSMHLEISKDDQLICRYKARLVQTCASQKDFFVRLYFGLYILMDLDRHWINITITLKLKKIIIHV